MVKSSRFQVWTPTPNRKKKRKSMLVKLKDARSTFSPGICMNSGRSSIALWHPVGLLSGEGWWGGVPDWPKNVWNNPSLGRLNDSCFRIPNNDMILLILSIYYCTYSYTKFDLPNSHLMFSSILFAIEKQTFADQKTQVWWTRHDHDT